MLFEEYLKVIDENKEDLYYISDHLWDNPETCFEEFEAVKTITEFLKKKGFEVTENLCGIPTAFKASYGKTAPSLGILAEYDALDGMSQEACITERKSISGMSKCHGCGHNLFAAGSVAATLAVKEYIQKTGVGTVTLFGCPAEEGGSGKVFLVRDGAFEGIDAIVSWHPESMYMVRTRPALANVKVDYSFEGIAAHAGANPDKGRSALDALELMNIGANFLREHMELSARIHYAILDAGGTAPNMVQSHAKVRYLIRATDSESVRDLRERIDRIAQGAALMTDTTVTSRVVSAYSNLITIPTLQATANEAMHDIPLPVPSEQELEYGRALQNTVKLTPQQKERGVFSTVVLDPAPPVAHGGSTDTADVSWVCPTVQMHIGTWAIGTPGHSWQSVSQCRGSYAKKSALYAGKAVAATIMRLIEAPELIAKAQAEHKEKIGEGYVCPLPDDLKPELY